VNGQSVGFLPVVEADLREAGLFYDSWQADGAAEFLERFFETVAWIEWNPEQFPRKHRQFRRAIIRRTYFGVFYVIEPGRTTIVAVLDLRQNPRGIRERLGLGPG
jgi:plasmid stabilization system protein ParE